MEETVFVLFLDNHFLGVYTSHRKATQAIILNSFKEGIHLIDYSFQFGTELFTYTDSAEDTYVYELMEVEPDHTQG